MSADELLALLRQHADTIRAAFPEDRLTALGDLLARLGAAGDDVTAARGALRDIRKMLVLYLPAGHELHVRISAEVRSAALAEAPASALRPSAAQLADVMTLLASVDWDAPEAEPAPEAEAEPAPEPAPAPGPAPAPDPAPDPAPAPAPALAPGSAALVRAARRRLLGAPARGAERLTAGTASDPLGAGLIRLTDQRGGARFPDFQFDPDTGEPRPVVQEINRLLLADEDPWGVADWWLGGNRWLRGAPADLLGDVPDGMLVDAARALVEDAAW